MQNPSPSRKKSVLRVSPVGLRFLSTLDRVQSELLDIGVFDRSEWADRLSVDYDDIRGSIDAVRCWNQHTRDCKPPAYAFPELDLISDRCGDCLALLHRIETGAAIESTFYEFAA